MKGLELMTNQNLFCLIHKTKNSVNKSKQIFSNYNPVLIFLK